MLTFERCDVCHWGRYSPVDNFNYRKLPKHWVLEKFALYGFLSKRRLCLQSSICCRSCHMGALYLSHTVLRRPRRMSQSPFWFLLLVLSIPSWRFSWDEAGCIPLPPRGISIPFSSYSFYSWIFHLATYISTSLHSFFYLFLPISPLTCVFPGYYPKMGYIMRKLIGHQVQGALQRRGDVLLELSLDARRNKSDEI